VATSAVVSARGKEDLLRATIVFTGVGLDATVKQLIRDALVHVIYKKPAGAREVGALRCRPANGDSSFSSNGTTSSTRNRVTRAT